MANSNLSTYDFHSSNIRVITSEDGVILLGSSTVQAYVRSDRLEERREVMQRWCDYVELCLKGGTDLLL
ncbi:hypothetical protein [Aeromonas veronii]|uniref:hypothetical protein n=1 Tax=Aeromonas veronii TaxID=654 RepID=UPI001E5A7D5C|nr:hypothetical protein [Aeromonas veronii]MCD6620069.1 hypothetical protein [Aeromonas veronii]